MAQLGRQRLQLAGPETLHLARVLTELFREWVCGGGLKFGESSSAWRSAVVGSVTEDGCRHFIGRLEFQDGILQERKQPKATVDELPSTCMALSVFAESIGPMKLPEKASATVRQCGGHEGYQCVLLDFLGHRTIKKYFVLNGRGCTRSYGPRASRGRACRGPRARAAGGGGRIPCTANPRVTGPGSSRSAHAGPLICLDLYAVDGRIFAVSAPDYVCIRFLLSEAGLPDHSRVRIYYENEPLPLPPGRRVPVRNGMCFSFVPPGVRQEALFSFAGLPTGREGDPLRGYVLDGQTGRTGSGWPQHLGENEYDSAQDKVRLHHNALDRRLGVRGYLPEVLDVLKCHQDLQLDRGSGLMLKYTATYLPKFSDGPGKELMDDTTAAAMAQLVESSSPFIRENQRCGFSSLTRPSPCSSWGVRCSRSLRATLVWR